MCLVRQALHFCADRSAAASPTLTGGCDGKARSRQTRRARRNALRPRQWEGLGGKAASMTYPEEPDCSFSLFRAQQPEPLQFLLLVRQCLVLFFPASNSNGNILLHPLRAHESRSLLVPGRMGPALHEGYPSCLVVGNGRAHQRRLGGSDVVPFAPGLVV